MPMDDAEKKSYDEMTAKLQAANAELDKLRKDAVTRDERNEVGDLQAKVTRLEAQLKEKKDEAGKKGERTGVDQETAHAVLETCREVLVMMKAKPPERGFWDKVFS